MTKNTSANDRLIWGVILIALGAIFLIQKIFDVEILSQIWQFWPLILIVWGVVLITRKK
ncbi:MAG TPA: DUF5668 domain-containing protein [Candidatus Saccharimonadales bacterium]|nr:DUF5668 domain-containing protein [Candidatus Saccharimonadales bacterium]